MTSHEKDRFICEKLGLCWHERDEKSSLRVCTCGYFVYYMSDFDDHCQENNPDFTSEAGRVQLLKMLPPKDMNLTKAELLECLKDDTGFFRDAVFKALGGEG